MRNLKLTKHKFDDELITTINAKYLHEFLELDTDYLYWINSYIGQYGFEQDIDYKLIQIRGKKTFYITLDMAKEIANAEKSEKGKQAYQFLQTPSSHQNFLAQLNNQTKTDNAPLEITETNIKTETNATKEMDKTGNNLNEQTDNQINIDKLLFDKRNALTCIQIDLAIAKLLNVPPELAKNIAVNEAKRITNIDYSNMLLLSKEHEVSELVT